jgi:hypothetical protein
MHKLIIGGWHGLASRRFVLAAAIETLETTGRKTPTATPAHGAPPTFPGLPLGAHISVILVILPSSLDGIDSD